MIFFEQLNELSESRSLVDISRDDLKADYIRGFILGTSAKLVLIGVVGDHFQHDGYSIIELDDITFLRWGTKKLLGWEKVLGGSEDGSMAKDLDLSSWWGAIEGAQAKFPLISFFLEGIDTAGCYISDRIEFSDLSIVGRHVSDSGERNGSFAFKTDDLTRIDFGGRYEVGLQRMLGMA